MLLCRNSRAKFSPRQLTAAHESNRPFTSCSISWTATNGRGSAFESSRALIPLMWPSSYFISDQNVFILVMLRKCVWWSPVFQLSIPTSVSCSSLVGTCGHMSYWENLKMLLSLTRTLPNLNLQYIVFSSTSLWLAESCPTTLGEQGSGWSPEHAEHSVCVAASACFRGRFFARHLLQFIL